MCEDRAGQFHHGKATNRIGSRPVSLSGISLAGLLTFSWVMHRNVGYNNNIFPCHGGKQCVRKHPSSWQAHHILPPSVKLRIFIIPRYMSYTFWAREAMELRNESLSIALKSFGARLFQTGSPWTVLLVWLTRGVTFSWRHLCATLISCSSTALTFFPSFFFSFLHFKGLLWEKSSSQ